MKARFVDKVIEHRFNEDFTIYFWEYRGMTYTTYVNHNKGNEPLTWQHKNEQSRIDSMLENKKSEKQLTEKEIEQKQKELWDALDMLWED